MKHVSKDGPAKHVVEEVLRTGTRYTKVITCLHNKYGWPCPIHKENVGAIVKVPLVKDGDGKELCYVYYIVIQHLHAVKEMEYKSYVSFIASALEMIADQSTIFEWQRDTGYEMYPTTGKSYFPWI